MKILNKRFYIVVSVCVVAAVMLLMTILSAVNLSNKSNSELSLEGGVPTVIESTDGGNIIGTRDGRVIYKTAHNELIWEYKLTSGGALRDIAVDGNEVVCITSETKEIFSLDLDSGTLTGKATTSYEPMGVVVSDSYVAVNTHLKTKNRLVVYARGGQKTDYQSVQSSENTIPELNNIEAMDGGIFGLGKDSIPYLFNPTNISASPQTIFPVTSEELLYMTVSEESYLAVTKEGSFVKYDNQGNIVSKNKRNDKLSKIASTDGRITVVTDSNKIIYFDGNKTYTVSANGSVSKLMISSEAIFLIDSSDQIIVYSFDRIIANNTWKILFPIFLSLLIAFAVTTVIAVFFVLPHTREKAKIIFKKIGKALWTYKKTYLFLLVPFTLLGVFAFFPAIWGFILAFTKYVPGLTMEFVGFGNFISAFTNPTFLSSSGNMLLFLLVDLIVGMIPCFILAEMMFLFRMKKLGYFARVLTVLPAILPGVVLVYVWTSGIYGVNGLINMVLQQFGFEQFNFNWLGNELTARNALFFYGFPFLGSYIMLFSALRGVPPSLMEASELDGCNKIRRIFTIDIPLLSTQFKYVFVTTFIASLQNFGRSYLTTGGEFGTMVPSLEIYFQINKYNDYGVAAAMSLVLFVIIFIATLVNQRIKTETF